MDCEVTEGSERHVHPKYTTLVLPIACRACGHCYSYRVSVGAMWDRIGPIHVLLDCPKCSYDRDIVNLQLRATVERLEDGESKTSKEKSRGLRKVRENLLRGVQALSRMWEDRKWKT